MTGQEALEKIKKEFPEEIAGFKNYMELSKVAYETHMDQGYHVLKDMAKEEFVHAKHLRNILMKHNMFTPEHEKIWLEAEKEYMAM